MSFGSRLLKVYFDYLYNPVYDYTTARLAYYRRLQARCISKLETNDLDRILCVGVGTGNEISHLLQLNKNVEIVGIDYSRTALERAQRKTLKLHHRVELLRMDAQHLEFPTGSFDKVLCFHVMDFVQDSGKVTGEILRVLKEGGQFLITYPSDKENARLGSQLDA